MTVNLIVILDDVVSMLERTLDKKIEVFKVCDLSVVYVNGDESQIQNSLLNLGINASHAMPEGGTLSYEVTLLMLSSEQCQNSTFNLAEGEYVQIAVKDTGCGIDSEHLERIFEPFFTTKPQGEGTGLGLSTVYAIVKQMNGSIAVFSEVGKGTEFRLQLPILQDVDMLENKDLNQLFTGKGRILLVDDEELMRVTGLTGLTRMGYDVEIAEDGVQTLEKLKTCGRFDLIILDMIMPKMNGRETFDQIKKMYPEIPVVLSSGFSKAEDVQEMQKCGLAGYLCKPFKPSELSKMIHDILVG
jgi:CheY-like chemotaxis protein